MSDTDEMPAAVRATALRDALTKWANPPTEFIGKLPKGGTSLDYMGHAAVTRALIEIDPMWSWQPVCDDKGIPIVQVHGKRLVMWGHITVLGKTIMCCGTCEDRKFEPEKELIGDLLRNGAMRFGVGLSLWAKEEWADLDVQPPASTPKPSELTDATWERLSAVGADLTTEQRAALNAWLTGKKLSLKRGDLDEGTALEVIEWIGRRS